MTNLSTSMISEKISNQFNTRFIRTPVGEINVVKKMLEVGAEFGGEGNGGVILKEAHLGRDSLVGVAMILNRMSQDKKPISEIHSSLPQFYIVKDKIDLENIDLNFVLDKAKLVFEDAKIDRLDGIKFIWDDRWIHLRSSNTEPIMRIYAEAPSKSEATDLINKIKNNI